MNARQVRVLASIDESLVCLSQPRFKIPRLAALTVALARSRRRISELHQMQHGASRKRSDAVLLARLRRELRDRWLRPVVKQGRLLLKGMPGAMEGVKMPGAHDKDAQLVAAARQIAEAAQPYRQAFLKAKFPKDFLLQIERATTSLERAMAGSAETAASRLSAATAGLKRDLQHAREIIAVLDSVIVAEFHDDPVAIKLWRHAKRIKGPIGRPRKRKARRPAPESSVPPSPEAEPQS